MALFGRSVSVNIGLPGTIGISLSNEFTIQFKGKKTLKPTTNNCEVSIYNLSEQTFKYINNSKNVMVLNAGYEEDSGESVLFAGNITRVFKEYSKPDIITRIEAMDGEKKLYDNKVSLSYEKGTALELVLTEIIGLMGVALSNKQYVVPPYIFNNGFSFVGNAADALTFILDQAELGWTIEDGALTILNEFSTTPQGIILSPETGMIGTPENLLDTSSKGLKKNPDRRLRYKINSVLYPKVKIGDYINVKARETFGTFKTVEHEFAGDNKTGDWRSTFEVVSLV